MLEGTRATEQWCNNKTNLIIYIWNIYDINIHIHAYNYIYDININIHIAYSSVKKSWKETFFTFFSLMLTIFYYLKIFPAIYLDFNLYPPSYCSQILLTPYPFNFILFLQIKSKPTEIQTTWQQKAK